MKILKKTYFLSVVTLLVTSFGCMSKNKNMEQSHRTPSSANDEWKQYYRGHTGSQRSHNIYVPRSSLYISKLSCKGGSFDLTIRDKYELKVHQTVTMASGQIIKASGTYRPPEYALHGTSYPTYPRYPLHVSSVGFPTYNSYPYPPKNFDLEYKNGNIESFISSTSRGEINPSSKTREHYLRHYNSFQALVKNAQHCCLTSDYRFRNRCLSRYNSDN